MGPEELAAELDLPHGITVRAIDGDARFRFHIDLSAEVQGYLIARVVVPKLESEQRTRRRRKLLFQTDLIEQLLESRQSEVKYQILGNLGHTHEERDRLVSRGLGEILARDALMPFHMAICMGWLWLFDNHVFYLSNECLTTAMIDRVSEYLLRVENGEEQRTVPVCHALEIIKRIALRGQSVRHLFQESTLQNIQRYCVLNRPPHFSFARENTFWCLKVLMALSHMTGNPHDLSFTVPFLEQFLLEIPNFPGWLQPAPTLRPGESLHMYLALCESDMSSDVRWVGLLFLTQRLQALSSPLFTTDPVRTISGDLYTEQAIEARLRRDSHWTDRTVDGVKKAYQGRQNLLPIETVLRLVNDEDLLVRHFAMGARDSIPASIKELVVWSPNMHRHFGEQTKQIVLSMLVLSRRGSVAIPCEILVRNIFPYACVATFP